MIEWLNSDPAVVVPALTMTSGVLLLSSLVLLVFWILSRRARRALAFDRDDAELDRKDLELALAEQTARLRIVRELHEVAVHSVSVMVTQAEGIRFAGEHDPAAAVRSSTVIEDAARTLQADLRRVMTVVGEGDLNLEIATSLQEVDGLFASMRAAGLEITVEQTGEPFELIQGAELAVMRILQESLTNALTHGGEGTEVKVSISWSEEALRVLIDDDGTRAAARRAGLDPNRVSREHTHNTDDDLTAFTEHISGAGLTEMKERAMLFGGVFSAYSVPGVGFSVAVAFPSLRYHNGVHGVNL